jgi:hypothetical protein
VPGPALSGNPEDEIEGRGAKRYERRVERRNALDDDGRASQDGLNEIGIGIAVLDE